MQLSKTSKKKPIKIRNSKSLPTNFWTILDRDWSERPKCSKHTIGQWQNIKAGGFPQKTKNMANGKDGSAELRTLIWFHREFKRWTARNWRGIPARHQKE